MSIKYSFRIAMYRFLAVFFSLNLIACSGASSSLSKNSGAPEALAILKKANWIVEVISPSSVGGFELFSARKPKSRNMEVLTIYIEGDGHAWEGSYPSLDPTPLEPIALRLALAQTDGATAYLARPCQYIGVKTNVQCAAKVWTDQRFSPKAIEVLQEGINYLKQASGAKQIVLIGYSGGGALALLAAAQRSDVIKIITVAGNVDTQAWIEHHHLLPMKDALNPSDFISKTKAIPQFLYVGGRDEVTPASIAYQYAKKFPLDKQPKVIEIPEYGHVCCWVDGWHDLQPMVNKP